jgi:ATP-dependent Clp protease ATP-binding subunit ClpC
LGFAVSRDADKLREDEYSTMRDRVTEALKRTFRPEFLNRLDGVMVFRNLTKEQITEIVDLELNRVRVQLKEQEITLEATDEVKGHLADAGYDPDYGARPLRRVIQDKLEDRLSEGLLGGWIKTGDTVRVELDSEGEIQLVTIPVTTEDNSLLAEAMA